MYVRTNAARADRERVEDVISFIRDEVMGTVSAMDGCAGLSLLVDRASGAVQLSSAWRDRDAMDASETGVAPLRERTAQLFSGPPTVERWEVEGMHRAHPTPQRGCARVTWFDVPPFRLDVVGRVFRGILVPALDEQPGFCGVSVLIDRERGRAATTVSWEDRASLEASRGFSREMRSTAVQENDVRVLDVAEYDVVLAHLRVPEMV